jgi:hypothetical protein
MSGSALIFARRHLRFGWWTLLAFSTLGVLLEVLHAFKAGLYLDVDNETRRLMWRLAHAHGGLLGLVHIAFAASVPQLSKRGLGRLPLVSACFMSSSVLLPLGFFLGGAFARDTEPGLPIALVPIGAVFLLAGIAWTALGLQTTEDPQARDRP